VACPSWLINSQTLSTFSSVPLIVARAQCSLFYVEVCPTFILEDHLYSCVFQICLWYVMCFRKYFAQLEAKLVTNTSFFGIALLKKPQNILYICLYTHTQAVPGGKVSVPGGHSISHSTQKSIYVHESYFVWFLSHSYFTVHCIDEQHTMSSHELQSALMLMVEFLKMYYTR
jgi:hypothetical protein